MINQQLLRELQSILKDDYKLDLDDQEVKVVGDQLTSGYETLLRLMVEEVK